MPTGQEWKDMIATMESGERTEIDEDTFWYFLGVLPPIYQDRKMEVGGKTIKVDFGSAEGYEKVKAFWREGKGKNTKYYCQKTNEMNPYA